MDSMYISKPARLWKSKADFFRPFRSAANEVCIDNNAVARASASAESSSYDEIKEIVKLSELNTALRTLVRVFPDIDPAVFRDMLSKLSPESRVEVVTEQILRKRGKPASSSVITRITQGLRKAPPADTRSVPRRIQPLKIEDTFRGEQYVNAVRTLLCEEFSSLGHSSIRAVMAENNDSYTRVRPVLQELSSRAWRFSISSLWTRRSTRSADTSHPAVRWQADDNPSGALVPVLIPTGCTTLDCELHDLFIQPKIQQLRLERVIADHTMAQQLNAEEAEHCQALFECDCCCTSAAFEEVVACASGQHLLCYSCIRRTTCEALYGQGWSRTADLDKASIRCFAPDTRECGSYIPNYLLQRALQTDLLNPHLWLEYQTRLSNEILVKSRLPLRYCPKCSYAEVDDVPPNRLRNWQETTAFYYRRLDRQIYPELAVLLASLCSSMTIILEAFWYALCLPLWMLWQVVLLLAEWNRIYLGSTNQVPIFQDIDDSISTVLNDSTKRVYKRHRGLKFKCQHPECLQVSCLRCRSFWHDPHICFEDEKTSLRTAIEASATAAVKRTCPRCMLSFIKSSGCNKLVCNCGYTMCYTCRVQITTQEGYAHFCQHFRPNGGRCRECNRCDLYGDEDEEAAIRKAAIFAEQEWRQKEAAKNRQQDMSTDTETAKAMMEAVLERDRHREWYEELLDCWLDARIVFLEDPSL